MAKRQDIYTILDRMECHTLEAYRHAKFGEWGASGTELAHTYLDLLEAADALGMDLDAEARKLLAEEKIHA